MKTRPTSFDIAALAGVSQATVSRALSGNGAVSEAVRQKVIEAARQLNYSVDVNARKLRSKQLNTVAVLVSEDLDSEDSPVNPFFLPMIGHIIKYAGRLGIDVLLSLQNPDVDYQQDYAFARRADGIIFLGYRDFDAAQAKIKALTDMGEAWVVFGAAHGHDDKIFIGSDNEGGAYAGVNHLIERGRKRIVYLGTNAERHWEFHERFAGYVRAHQEAGLKVDPTLSVDCYLSFESARRAMASLIAQKTEFDAVFCVTDMMAMGAMKALKNHGLRIPQDVSVLGFDDLWASEAMSLALSTIKQDTAGAARALVDALIAQKAGEAVANVVLPTRLMIRETS